MNRPDTLTTADIAEKLRNKLWRLNNLYWIQDEQGQRVKFRLNWAQELLYHTMWYLCIILKARQIGFTTFVCIFTLDECIFRKDTHAGIIAHNREDAEAFFADKIKYPYDNLSEHVKKIMGITCDADTVRTLKFSNGSSVRVGTSLRSGTMQILHISEYGKICARYPEKAREIRTGAFNTVHPGQRIFVESTAEGFSGDFADMCESARDKERRGVHLTPMDFRFFFFPWWRHPKYRIECGYESTPELEKYFGELAKNHGIELDQQQKAWYGKKSEIQKDEMFREYPSTPEEAFAAKITGCWFGSVAARLVQHRKTGAIGTLREHKAEIVFDEDPMGILEIWRHPQHLTDPDAQPWVNRYCIGSDIGEGLQQDYSVAYVFDRVRKELVARMRSNKVDAVTWANMLIHLARYYQTAIDHDDGKVSSRMCLIIPERTGAGITTCKQLSDKNANVFNHIETAQDGKVVGRKVGWVQTKESKFSLLGDFREYMESTTTPVYCGVLLAECGVYIHDRETGTLGAAEGYHDDCVIAAALAKRGDYYLDAPYQIKLKVEGWRKRQKEQGETAWSA